MNILSFYHEFPAIRLFYGMFDTSDIHRIIKVAVIFFKPQECGVRDEFSDRFSVQFINDRFVNVYPTTTLVKNFHIHFFRLLVTAGFIPFGDGLPSWEAIMKNGECRLNDIISKKYVRR